MDENIELMKHIYKVSDMGVSSTKSLIDCLKNRDNKIKELLEDELQEYEKYHEKSKEYLNNLDIVPKKESLFAKMGSDMGIMMETIKDNSDSAIASMLIEGFTMGMTELEGLVSKYKKKINRKVLSITKEFLKFHKKSIEKLKTFI
jgi:hypothetical protein